MCKREGGVVCVRVCDRESACSTGAALGSTRAALYWAVLGLHESTHVVCTFAAAEEVLHARPLVGIFQESISIRFINFWRYFPTKTNQWLQERTWDTPTKDLLW